MGLVFVKPGCYHDHENVCGVEMAASYIYPMFIPISWLRAESAAGMEVDNASGAHR